MLSSDAFLALFGGILISIASSFNLFFTGRITGMSGIYFGFINFDRNSFYWRCAFLLMMMITTIFLWNITGFENFLGFDPLFDQPSLLVKNLSRNGYFLAGLLVGTGVRLGNGCTSGHGVCGLPRLSIRSWVFVPIFLFFGILMATYRDYAPFLVDETPFEGYDLKQYGLILNGILSLSLLIVIAIVFVHILSRNTNKLADIVFTSITAILFTLGLIISGMNKRSKILGFLTINKDWDPSLMIVLCGAVGLNFITFNLIKSTVMGRPLEIPKNKSIDGRLLLGGMLFGLGWGLGGLCPGPGFVLFPFLTPHISLAWFGGLTLGHLFVKFYDRAANDITKVKAH